MVSETINGGGQTFTQTFGYDADNRLTSGSDTGGWSRNFSYDQYGNMWVSGSSGIALSALTPSAQSWYIASSNRIQGDNYDLAGNQLNFGSAGTVTLAYDAANRVKSSAVAGTGNSTYQYDGSGRRVLRVTPDGVTSVYVYDAAGQLAAKYSSGSTPTAPCNTCYISWDHLGTSRLMTDASGTVIDRHDFLPFGEEILSNQAGRTTAWDTSDNLNQKFTGKLRDAETGLDYFGARYYGGVEGRFVSADEFKGGIVDPITGQDIETNTALPYADITDPQTLNKYAYVRDNPLRYIDPDGHCFEDGCVVEGTVTAAVGTALLYYTYKLGTAIRDTLNSQYQPAPVQMSGKSDDSSKGTPPPAKAANQAQSASAQTPEPEKQGNDRQGAQDKKLARSEVKTLESNTGQDVHDIKGDIVGNKNVSKYDLFKTRDGDIVVKPKGGSGSGEPTGYTTEHLKKLPNQN